MKVILEMIKKKEKEFIIIMKNLLKVIDMKVIIEMIKNKEKEFIIFIMVIDMKVINDKREGKGIMYYHNGDRMMGDYYKDKQIGKHVMLKEMVKLK